MTEEKVNKMAYSPIEIKKDKKGITPKMWISLGIVFLVVAGITLVHTLPRKTENVCNVYIDIDEPIADPDPVEDPDPEPDEEGNGHGKGHAYGYSNGNAYGHYKDKHDNYGHNNCTNRGKNK